MRARMTRPDLNWNRSYGLIRIKRAQWVSFRGSTRQIVRQEKTLRQMWFSWNNVLILAKISRFCLYTVLVQAVQQFYPPTCKQVVYSTNLLFHNHLRVMINQTGIIFKMINLTHSRVFITMELHLPTITRQVSEDSQMSVRPTTHVDLTIKPSSKSEIQRLV